MALVSELGLFMLSIDPDIEVRMDEDLFPHSLRSHWAWLLLEKRYYVLRISYNLSFCVNVFSAESVGKRPNDII